MTIYKGTELIAGVTTTVDKSERIGQIIQSTIPLTDAGLHELNGAKIGRGIYSDFVDYIAMLYAANPYAEYFAQPSTESEVPWQQPILSGSNGIIGGNSFAVSCAQELNTKEAWYAFDGVVGTATGENLIFVGQGVPIQLIIYNPEPIKISSMVCENYVNEYARSGTIDVSVNGVTWTTITTWTTNTTTNPDTWTIDVNSPGFYKYYRLNIQTVANLRADFREITIYATQLVSGGATAEEVWWDEVNTKGVCGKFVYDPEANTVRLPKYGKSIFTNSLSSTAPVKGNGMSLGITTGGQYGGTIASNFSAAANALEFSPNSYGQSIGTTGSQGSVPTNNTRVGITQDGTKSGMIADLSSITTSSSSYYYVVVATAKKTEIVVDIDEVATDLNSKADIDLTNVTNTSGFRRLVEIGTDGTRWYKVFDEYNPVTGVYVGKWCEQGGVDTGTFSRDSQISLNKPYNNTNYTLVGNAWDLNHGATGWAPYQKNTSYFQGQATVGTNQNLAYHILNWVAYGYIV